jgi:hypothetical protein
VNQQGKEVGWGIANFFVAVIGVAVAVVAILVAHADVGKSASTSNAQGTPSNPASRLTHSTALRSSPSDSRTSGLSGEERALRDGLNPGAGGADLQNCVSARPLVDFVSFSATIECESMDPQLTKKVRFSKLPDPATLETFLTKLGDGTSSNGTCGTDTTGRNNWDLEGRGVGRLICDVQQGEDGAKLYEYLWIATSTQFVAKIQDVDRAKGYSWWRAHAGVLPT